MSNETKTIGTSGSYSDAVSDTRKAVNNVGAEPWPGNSKLLADHMRADLKLWGDIIKLAKIEPQ